MKKNNYVGFLGSLSGKVATARLLPATDLLEGIEEICRDYGIRYGICWCHGSLRKMALYIPGVEGKGVRRYEKHDYGQVVAATGIICETPDGEKDIHLHLVVNDEVLRFTAGHAKKGETTVGDTMDVVIMEIKGGKMLRKLDKETGEVEFAPEPE